VDKMSIKTLFQYDIFKLKNSRHILKQFHVLFLFNNNNIL